MDRTVRCSPVDGQARWGSGWRLHTPAKKVRGSFQGRSEHEPSQLVFLNMLRTLAFSTLKNPQPSQTSASLRPLALQLLSATDTVSLINCGIKSLQPNEHAEDKLPRGAAEIQGVRVQHDEGGQRTTEIPHHVIHPTVTTLVPSSWATQMQEQVASLSSVTCDTSWTGDLCHSTAPLELCTYLVAANGKRHG